MQPGSSIMPGQGQPGHSRKWSTRSAFKVIGNDLTVTLAAEAGQLELNVMEPVIAQCDLRVASTMLKNAAMEVLKRALCRRHHRQRGRLPRLHRARHRRRHRAGSRSGLRRRHRPGQASAAYGTRHRGAGAREETTHRGADRPPHGSRPDGGRVGSIARPSRPRLIPPGRHLSRGCRRLRRSRVHFNATHITGARPVRGKLNKRRPRP